MTDNKTAAERIDVRRNTRYSITPHGLRFDGATRLSLTDAEADLFDELIAAASKPVAASPSPPYSARVERISDRTFHVHFTDCGDRVRAFSTIDGFRTLDAAHAAAVRFANTLNAASDEDLPDGYGRIGEHIIAVPGAKSVEGWAYLDDLGDWQPCIPIGEIDPFQPCLVRRIEPQPVTATMPADVLAKILAGDPLTDDERRQVAAVDGEG